MTGKFKEGTPHIKNRIYTEPKILSFSINEEIFGSQILKIKEIVDTTTNVVFTHYLKELIEKPITFIIHAVWGGIGRGELTASQEKINKDITLMICNIWELMEFENITEAQGFAIEYFIRGLAISKIAYLIELNKNRMADKPGQNDECSDLINRLETIGNA